MLSIEAVFIYNILQVKIAILTAKSDTQTTRCMPAIIKDPCRQL